MVEHAIHYGKIEYYCTMHDLLSLYKFILHGSTKTQPIFELDLSSSILGYKPLSFEDADRILQNVLRVCGYKETHLKSGNDVVL